MAGRTVQPASTPAPDAKGICAKGCRSLAARLGFDEDEVWFCFAQLAMCVEFETKWPRTVAEYHALRLVEQVFDKQGAIGS